MSIRKVSIREIKAARALLGWTQEQLADASGVSLPTIKRLEAADGTTLGGRPATVAQIVAALESAGAQFQTGKATRGVRISAAKVTPEL